MKDCEEDYIEIDFFSLFKTIWKRRLSVLKVTLCCMAIGLFLAFFSPEQYTSVCTFVPTMGQGMISKYSSIASMMGFDLSLASSGTDGQFNPRLYPLIMDNPKLQKDLMYTKIHVEKASAPVTVYDYYTSSEYRKFNLVGFIARYTVGLPQVILGRFKKDKEPVIFEDNIPSSDNGGVLVQPVIRMTKQEDEVARILNKTVRLEVDVKKGYLTLTARMPEAQASTEVCQSAYHLLQQYIREYKREKSENNLSFISAELIESRKDYENSQNQLAEFLDSNIDIDRAKAKVNRIRLEFEYEKSKQLYSELAKQELSARVKVNEETVSFTELAPPSVPLKRTSPKRTQMLVIWTFLGVIAGCAYAIGKEKYQNREEVN